MKLEVPNTGKHIFVVRAPLEGRDCREIPAPVSEKEQKWPVSRICMVAFGEGPKQNVLRLHAVGFFTNAK